MGAYKVTINADAYISSATTDVPVLVKFNSTDHPDLFLTGDTEDSVWFSSDAGGQTTLYHEGVVFSATDAIFYVKVDLSSTADTVIYFWYGTPSITGTESKTNVWTNAVTIAHYVTDETNPTATVGTDGTKINATFTASGRAVGGAYTTASNGFITHGIITPASISVIFWIKKNGCSTNYTKIIGELFESGGNVSGWEMDIPAASTGYVRFGRLSGANWAYWKSATVSTSIKDNVWHLVAGTYDGTNIKCNIDGGTQASTSATGNIVYNYGSTLYVGHSGINSGTNEEETFDNIWVFSDAKSLDWIKAVYNNVQNYGSFIDIEIFKSKITTPNILSFNSNVKFKKKKKLLLQDNLLFNSNLHQTKEIPKISWDITIKSDINTYNLKDLNILESAEYSMTYDKKSNNMSLTVLNDGSYWNKFKKGGNVSFYLINDYTQQKTKLFEGIITYVGQNLNNFDFSTIDIRAENYGMFRLKQTLVTGTKEYINRTPTQIIKNLIQTYAPDIKLDKLQEIDINIPYKFFNWIYLNEAIEEVTKLIEGYYYIDVDNYLIVKLFSDQKVSKELTKRKIVRAKIEDDIEDVFDRIFILGGKEHLLDNDFSDDDIVLGNNTKDYSYATKLATDRTNLLSIEIAVSKVGIPRYPLSFDIVADKSGMPSDNVLGSGNFYEWDIQEDVSWVKSNPISISFAQPAVFWVVFNNTTDFENYYVIYHDNETENGHKRSSDGVNWSNATGKIAIKNYYGYQIVSIKKGEKQLNKFYSDFLLADENIETK